MKLSFRWYGEDDKVTLENIRQIPGMQSIVTAVYDVPVGEVWSRESIAGLKKQVEDAGLGFDVIESIPVHEDIKLGKDTRDKYIANYCENIRRVAEAGIKCICYNFMPVFDWTRTQLDHELGDGSTSLVYYQEQVDAVNPMNSDSDLTLPGWDSSYTKDGLKAVVAEYNSIDVYKRQGQFLSIPISAAGSTAWARIPIVSSVSVIQTSSRPVQATVNSLFKISLCPPSARAYKANRRSPGCTSTPVKYQTASGSLTIICVRCL